MEKQRAFLIGKGCRSVLQWCKRRDVKALYRWIDIGLNLFSRSFPDPEKTLREAEEAGVYCILTGSDGKENEKVADFVRTHACRGTAGIHPHNAQRAVQADFERIRALNASRREAFATALTALGAKVPPSHANFLLCDFGRDMRPAIEALREKCILVRPCGMFPGLSHAHIRLCVRTEGENERLVGEMRHV